MNRVFCREVDCSVFVSLLPENQDTISSGVAKDRILSLYIACNFENLCAHGAIEVLFLGVNFREGYFYSLRWKRS